MKIQDFRSTGEKLKDLKWAIIKFDLLSIYFESCYDVCDEQALALELIFKKGLNPIFKCQSFLHFQCKFSATVVHNLDNPFWFDKTVPTEQHKLAFYQDDMNKIFIQPPNAKGIPKECKR